MRSRTVTYNQSPVIDISATNSAPAVGISIRVNKPPADNLKPFIRQIQNAQDANDPYQSAFKHKPANRSGLEAVPAKVIGLAHRVPNTIAPAKNSKCVRTSHGIVSRADLE
jgi:hypothetical protein